MPRVGFHLAKGCTRIVSGGCGSGVGSGIGCSFREVADRRCGEQATDVLDHHELRLQRLDRCRHVRPEPRAGAGCEAGLVTDRGYVLAWEAAAEDVHRRDGAPVDGGDVTEVRRVGPVVGEGAGDGFVDLGEPDGLGVEDVLDGQVEAAVSGVQRPDPQTTVLRRGVVVHEGSGGSVTPDPNPSRSPLPG